VGWYAPNTKSSSSRLSSFSVETSSLELEAREAASCRHQPSSSPALPTGIIASGKTQLETSSLETHDQRASSVWLGKAFLLGISSHPKATELQLLCKCSLAGQRAEYTTFALATLPPVLTESPQATLQKEYFPCQGIRHQPHSPKPMLSPLQTIPASPTVLTWLFLVLLIQFELCALSHSWLFQEFRYRASSQQLVKLGAGWPELLSVGDILADGFLQEAGLFLVTQPCQGALALLCEMRLLLPLSGTHCKSSTILLPPWWHHLNAKTIPCFTPTASSLPLLFCLLSWLLISFRVITKSQCIHQVITIVFKPELLPPSERGHGVQGRLGWRWLCGWDQTQ